jgi:proteasome accessory factor C
MNDLTARLRRLLFLVPYVAREQRHGVKLEQLGRELGIDKSDLLADVDLLTQVGPPGGDPSEYLLVSVEDG